MRLRRGIIAVVVLSWSLAVLPMIASLAGLSGGERSIQAMGVVFVAVFAAPVAFVLGLGFIPAHAILKRRGSRSVVAYMLAGVIIVSALAAAFLINNEIGRSVAGDIGSDYRWFCLVVAAVGAVNGAAFWFGAVWRSEGNLG